VFLFTPSCSASNVLIGGDVIVLFKHVQLLHSWSNVCARRTSPFRGYNIFSCHGRAQGWERLWGSPPSPPHWFLKIYRSYVLDLIFSKHSFLLLISPVLLFDNNFYHKRYYGNSLTIAYTRFLYHISIDSYWNQDSGIIINFIFC